ncbi:Arm DNA-binding domain-containing protein [Abyssibius alkaniclasticus]|uniref:Arm DNA-binding domain-containing protein n=1 Tax=Abyssibius alkaniclasticus TaxID=2881234 RepID=UPI00236391A0|nr:Arm DNA-binding domain-containing protein [Abyssibius alkaniclasticus]UPH72226.1 Arm DNA-binding domain-containing protein [Abyssibius alkaniclasticus]
MASHHLNFTKAALSKAPAAVKGGKDYYYDEREKGLVMAVTGAGTKSFYLYKRIDGKPERLLLGRFPDISVENARKLAMAASKRNPARVLLGKPDCIAPSIVNCDG